MHDVMSYIALIREMPLIFKPLIPKWNGLEKINTMQT